MIYDGYINVNFVLLNGVFYNSLGSGISFFLISFSYGISFYGISLYGISFYGMGIMGLVFGY